jgi:hypothetical protein
MPQMYRSVIRIADTSTVTFLLAGTFSCLFYAVLRAFVPPLPAGCCVVW